VSAGRASPDGAGGRAGDGFGSWVNATSSAAGPRYRSATARRAGPSRGRCILRPTLAYDRRRP